nr:MAG TPA: hypothetical protein [Caudoviricetes sp.]
MSQRPTGKSATKQFPQTSQRCAVGGPGKTGPPAPLHDVAQGGHFQTTP